MIDNLVSMTSTLPSGDEGFEKLVQLWYVAEDVCANSAPDFEQDCKLEPYRNKAIQQQTQIAESLIEIPVSSLGLALSKLLIWEAACGPGPNETLETSGDTYTFLLLSAIEDISQLVKSRQLSS